MHRASLAVLLAVCACHSSAGSDDIVGPFTGEVHRFIVDDFVFPMNTTEARASADDLDGDRQPDNQLGMVLSTLAGQGIITMHDVDIIGAGVVASIVEVQADDLLSDPEAGVSYFGRDDEPATVVGGGFVDGVFVPNRTRSTRAPGRAVLHLPAFVEADPSIVELIGMEIELHPDGSGGYHAIVRGGVTHEDALVAAVDGIMAMLRNNPGGHRQMRVVFDDDVDGVVTRAEIERSDFLAALLSPDVMVFDGRDIVEALSIGFRVHLTPCARGHCAAPPTDLCSDRARDGNETDIDCGGGTCLACPADAACTAPSDCQSGTCAQGRCTAPTCSDGVRNNFESDIDCGGGCARCPAGRGCYFDTDCASNDCHLGACTAP